MATPKKSHYPAITDPKDVAKLLPAIDGYQGGRVVVAAALRLSPLFFIRPGVIRKMEWHEIDWEGARWDIPAEKMKSDLPHIIPLSRQALEILRELQQFTGRGSYQSTKPR